jgi:hypothetical protein
VIFEPHRCNSLLSSRFNSPALHLAKPPASSIAYSQNRAISSGRLRLMPGRRFIKSKARRRVRYGLRVDEVRRLIQDRASGAR